MLPINDTEIDKIIWEEIHDSPSGSDFGFYIMHAPVGAKHLEAASVRMKKIGDAGNEASFQYPRAIDRIRKLAESGDASALFHMGKINALGIGMRQDLDSAVWWYEKAMAAGEPRAFANLGWFYQSGYGVRQNREKAFELLSQGAEGGVVSARAAVGMMLLAGEGCTADVAKGMGMLEDAFNQGYTNAGNLLADICFAGQQVPRDIEKGHEWLFRVVERGDERTMAILGHYLVAGTHGRTDREKGLMLLETAAIDHGYLPAFLWMAALYRNGTGVPRNPGMAREWYEKGIAAGCRECEAALAQMLSGNSPGVTPPGDMPLH